MLIIHISEKLTSQVILKYNFSNPSPTSYLSKLPRKSELTDLALASVAASGRAAHGQSEDLKAGSSREKAKNVDSLHDERPKSHTT